MADEEITRLLAQVRDGDFAATNLLLPLVYAELRRIANGHLRRHAPGLTLQPTDLIHEAWLRIADAEQPEWQSRLHFFAFTAAVMRNILVDHARSRMAEKRGGGREALSLDQVVAYAPDQSEDLLALDDALTRLAEVDERKARILELRFFAGLGIEETAETMGLSIATVVRDTRFAQAWLRNDLGA